MSTTTSSRPPTAPQLRYLRALATRTGQTFVAPTTIGAASREIRRLKAQPATSGRDRQIERHMLERHAPARDSARVTDSEIVGWGASARWIASRS
jgi:hypothetical protein